MRVSKVTDDMINCKLSRVYEILRSDDIVRKTRLAESVKVISIGSYSNQSQNHWRTTDANT